MTRPHAVVLATALVLPLALGGCERSASFPHWHQAGPMAESRGYFGIAVLDSGDVLVAGGGTSDDLTVETAGAEIFDRASGAWTPTGSMATPRTFYPLPALVKLPGGKVLIAGGVASYDAATGNFTYLSSAEVYDPATGRWAPTGSMRTARPGPSLLLRTGKVLAVGGALLPDMSAPGNGPSASAELYDPATGEWTPTGSMVIARLIPVLVMLESGEVLAVGGYYGADMNSSAGAMSSSEIYDPLTGTWKLTGYVGYGVTGGTAALLPGGEVLLIGGGNAGSSGHGDWDVNCSLYDPARGTWRRTGSTQWGREFPAAFPLGGGRVLVAGGTLASLGRTHTEIYDRATETWTEGRSLRHDHGNGQGGVMMPGGEMLITGGFVSRGADAPSMTLAATETYRYP